VTFIRDYDRIVAKAHDVSGQELIRESRFNDCRKKGSDMIRLKNAFPLILAVQAAWLSAWRPAGKPAPLPPRGAKVLPDRQKISAWRWAKTWCKFYRDDADAALKRPVTFAVTVPALRLRCEFAFSFELSRFCSGKSSAYRRSKAGRSSGTM